MPAVQFEQVGGRGDEMPFGLDSGTTAAGEPGEPEVGFEIPEARLDLGVRMCLGTYDFERQTEATLTHCFLV